MKPSGRKRLAAAGCALLASGALLGCRKPPPDEIVYTGAASPEPGGGSGNAGSGAVQPRPTGSAGAGSAPAPTTTATGGTGGTGAIVEPPPPGSEGCAPVVASTAAFSKLGLLGAAADCAVWHYCSFEESARALDTATAANATTPSAQNLASVRAAYATAMLRWQRAELFRFGPAARSTEPGGKDLRDLIYAWPLRAECKVDEQTVSQSFRSPNFHTQNFAVSPLTGRTLSALEYLLFNEALTNNCTQYAAINATGSWAALSASDIQSRRRAYAAEAAKDVGTQALALTRAWSAEGDDFRARLVSPGPQNATFTSEQQALNAVAVALFYLDLEVKDFKLATPLGLTPECTSTACPDAIESRYTQLSLAYLQENLEGFRRLFEGCGENYAGLGFDDWLRDAGAGDLADRMVSDLAAAHATARALSGSLAQLLVSNKDGVAGVRTAIKKVTDELKTEMVTILNLELPATSEGDND